MKVIAVTRLRDEEQTAPWLLANLTFADDIFVLDTGSEDGTLDLVCGIAAKDSRVTLGLWGVKADPFIMQWEHFNSMYRLTLERRAEYIRAGEIVWYFYTEADDYPNLRFQSSIRRSLDMVNRGFSSTEMGIDVPHYLIAPGWRDYYVTPSQRGLDLFNYVPEYKRSPIGGRSLVNFPEKRMAAPYNFAICETNWALEERFARKRLIYEKLPWFNYPSWHPDEKFKEKRGLPGYIDWHSPDGGDVKPRMMKEYMKDGKLYEERVK